MKLNNMRDLFLHELKDLHSAESQLTKALPKMAKAAASESLRQAVEEHLEVTRRQLDRLNQIFEQMGISARGKKCEAMEGLISEAEELIKTDGEDMVKDAALIGAAQKVEHYEIAGYGTACTFAKLLGEQQALRLLLQSLEEEKETDQELTQLAESEINIEAMQEQ